MTQITFQGNSPNTPNLVELYLEGGGTAHRTRETRMGKREVGEGRRRITPGDRLLGKPTTGDGRTGGQKPNLSDTNLRGGQPKSRLRLPRWLGGRHRA